MIIDELITLMKFDVTGQQKAQAYEQLIEDIGTVAKTTATAIGGTLAAVGYFAKSVAQSTAKNYEWAKSAGVDITTYQRLGQVAEQMGGELDDIKGDMEMWARTAKASGRSIEEIFLDEARAVQHLSADQSRALLSQKGYSDQAIRMIQAGEGELKNMLSKAQVLPEENLKSSLRFARTWQSVVSQLQTSLTNGVAKALPAIENVVRWIGNFIEKNKELISSHIQAFFTSVAIVAKGFLYALTPIVWVISKIIKVFDTLTFGMGKYLILIPALTAVFTAFAVAVGVKTYLAIKSAIATGTAYIGKLATLLGLMKTRLVLALAGAKATAFENAEAAKNAATAILQKTSLLGLVKAKIVSIAMSVKQLALDAAHRAMLIGHIAKMALLATWHGIVTVATWAWTAAQWALNVAMSANPVGLIILAVIAGIATIIGLMTVVIKYWDQIVSGIRSAVDWVVNFFAWMKEGNSTLAKILKGVMILLNPLSLIYFYWDEIIAALQWFWGVLKQVFNWWWTNTVNNFSKIWTYIKSIPSKISGAVKIAFGFVTNIFGKIWNYFANLLSRMGSKITGMVSGIWNSIRSVVSGLFTQIVDLGKTVLGKIFGWLPTKVQNVLSSVWTSIKNGFIGAVNWLLGKISGGVNAGIGILNKLIEGVNLIPGINIDKIKGVDFSIPEAEDEETVASTGNLSPSAVSSVAVGPSANATASPSQVNNNSTRSVVINNNNTINTSASSGPAIANYLSNANAMQTAGFGSVVTA